MDNLYVAVVFNRPGVISPAAATDDEAGDYSVVEVDRGLVLLCVLDHELPGCVVAPLEARDGDVFGHVATSLSGMMRTPLYAGR